MNAYPDDQRKCLPLPFPPSIAPTRVPGRKSGHMQPLSAPHGNSGSGSSSKETPVLNTHTAVHRAQTQHGRERLHVFHPDHRQHSTTGM